MRKIQYLAVVLALFASSCGTAAIKTLATARPTSTTGPVAQPTQTSLPTPTTIPEPPSAVNFVVADGVPSEDLLAIKNGVALAHAYIETIAGEDITTSIPLDFIVEANGAGKEGSCCTALAKSGAQPFIDVLHPIWTVQIHEGKMAAAAHEYVHAWQNRLGCMTIHDQPLGSWLNEGIATYISINAIASTGLVEKVALIGSNGNLPGNFLSLLQIKPSTFTTSGAWWGYDLAYLGVDHLVNSSELGTESLEVICTQIASGASRPEAFEAAFGISLKEFDQVFLDLANALPTPEVTPTAKTSGLSISGTVSSVYDGELTKYVISLCPAATHICQDPTPLTNQGTFVFYVELGRYLLSITRIDGNQVVFWYSEDGVNKDEYAGTIITVNDLDVSGINFQVP